jgi:tetratricopeptide (TPR) repeat protein
VELAVLVLLMHFGLEIDSSYPTMIALLFMTVGIVYQPMHHRKLRGVQLVAVPAVAILLAAVAISLNFSRVQADRGSIANDNHDYSAAAGYYAKAHSGLAYNPDNWTAEGIDDYALAGITGSKAYLALAKDRANQAIARDPKDSQHYFLRARTERLGGDYNSAITDYENALKLDMYNHPDYYLDLAQTKLQQGDKQAAQAVALRGLSLYSDSVIAQRSADPAIKPAVAGLLVVTSYEQIAQGNMQEAKRSLNRALRLDPNNFDAQTLLQQGQDIIKPGN